MNEKKKCQTTFNRSNVWDLESKESRTPGAISVSPTLRADLFAEYARGEREKYECVVEPLPCDKLADLKSRFVAASGVRSSSRLRFQCLALVMLDVMLTLPMKGVIYVSNEMYRG
ncbi:hypothetical protein KM043_014225 [Ampulex compressa]|nr:hypothetical protein KM043_014225 [Ampulex compressa]